MKKPLAIRLALPLSILVLISACSELDPVREKIEPAVEKAEPKLEKAKSRVRQKIDQILHPGKGKSTTPSFGVEQMVTAIKQALSQGVNDSIYLLGTLEGFNLSKLYHIPIPQKLEKPAKLLRKLGQGEEVDEFELRLNRSAQQAVKQATDIFTGAIKQMTVSDALNILEGQDNAATLYFRDKTETRLRARFLPIISKATSKTGLTSSYKSLNDSLNKIYPKNSYTMDIDQYVLDHAMNALFDRIAVEERLIREQPVKRTTEIMKQVFGYFEK